MCAPPEENFSPNVARAGEAAGKPMEEGLRASTVLFTKSGHQIIVSFSPTAWTSESAVRVGGLAQMKGLAAPAHS
jgi:hypothetical protein